jgi:hypothetical protein
MADLPHRTIVDALSVLAKALPRFEHHQNMVFEDPAFAVVELGLENSLSSAIVIEPMNIEQETMGSDTHDQRWSAHNYLHDLILRVAFLATTTQERDQVAKEFMPFFAGQIAGTYKALRVVSTAFGKEEAQNPIFGMSVVVRASYHTKSDAPDVPIIPQ